MELVVAFGAVNGEGPGLGRRLFRGRRVQIEIGCAGRASYGGQEDQESGETFHGRVIVMADHSEFRNASKAVRFGFCSWR